MNWIVSFIVGVLVGQEVHNIPRVKPILEQGFTKTMQYMDHLKTQQQKDEVSQQGYYEYVMEYIYPKKKDE